MNSRLEGAAIKHHDEAPGCWISIIIYASLAFILTGCATPNSPQTTASRPSIDVQNNSISAATDPAANSKDQALLADAKATLDFWNSLYECLDTVNQRMKGVLASLDKQEQSQDAEVTLLNSLAEHFSRLAQDYSSSVSRLPVLGVDDRVLSYAREDVQKAIEGAGELSGMAEAANNYLEWYRRKENSSGEKVFGDLLYSFAMGFMGQPFAGYSKMKEEAANLDVGGQQIANEYLSHAQALNQLIQESAGDDVKEMDLRNYLAKKYRVEFKPMPKSD